MSYIYIILHTIHCFLSMLWEFQARDGRLRGRCVPTHLPRKIAGLTCLRILVYVTLGRCPLSIVCSRGTPP